MKNNREQGSQQSYSPLVYMYCRISVTAVHVYSIIHVHTYMLMRDEEGRKKQARSNKQQGIATQHTQGSHFS